MNAPRRLALAGRPARRGDRVPLAWPTACVALALTACSGCGRGLPPATVEGTVHLKGKILDNCLVTFFPEPGQEANCPHSTGLTDQQGRYRLRHDDGQEGAAIGWHRVTVQDLSVSTGVLRRDHGTVDLERDETAPPPPARRSRVAPRYTSPAETPLRKQVKPGHQVIDLDVH